MSRTMPYLVCFAGCLLFAAGIVAMVLASRMVRKRRSAPVETTDAFRSVDDAADALRGDPRRIAAGDIVEIRNVSYAVRGTVRYTEGSWNWSEHLLDDVDGAKVWLSVEEDPDLELVLWKAGPAAAEGLGADVRPGAAIITIEGRRFSRQESGRARFAAAGTTGLHPNGTVRYHDYRAEDGLRLSFEAYGDDADWELGIGEQLHRGEVMIYPRAGQPGQAD